MRQKCCRPVCLTMPQVHTCREYTTSTATYVHERMRKKAADVTWLVLPHIHTCSSQGTTSTTSSGFGALCSCAGCPLIYSSGGRQQVLTPALANNDYVVGECLATTSIEHHWHKGCALRGVCMSSMLGDHHTTPVPGQHQQTKPSCQICQGMQLLRQPYWLGMLSGVLVRSDPHR
jgi:hypothetical protein